MLDQRISSAFERIGVSFYATKKSFVTDCPGCGKEEHTYVRKKDGRAICFKCGRKWTILFFLARLLNSDETNAYQYLHGEGAGDDLDRPLDLSLFLGDKSDGDISRPMPVDMGIDFIGLDRSSDAVSYVVSRGIMSADLIMAYDLRYHYLMNAVVFPVKKDGLIFGWQARRIAPKEGELRLISATGFNKSEFLLNYDRASQAERMIITEGPFDCMKVDLQGLGAVCSFGKQISQSQIRQILEAKSESIYVGLDPDAFTEMYDVVSRLGTGKKIFRVLPPPGRKDFGECSEQEVLAAVENAKQITSPSDYLELYFK